MIEIPYNLIDIYCEPEDELYLPQFKGSSFRGVIGRTLRKALCVLKSYEACPPCPLKNKCYYAYLFETIPSQHGPLPFNLHKYPAVPHPFVIEPPEEEKRLFTKGEVFALRIILIGKATQYEPYFLLAIRYAGEHGIGKGNKKFYVVEYRSSGTQKCYLEFNEPSDKENISQISLRVITPLRLIHERRLVKRLEFHHLIRALLRRLTILYYFHVNEAMPEIPAKRLIEQAMSVKTVNESLRWFDWERYSFRQKRRMTLGGLVGEVTFEGNLAPFYSILRAGEIFHCGKNTSFGLGKYRITFVKG